MDVKTSRRETPNKITGFTIGSYAGYFLHPDKQCQGCRIPYGKFSEHWVIGFVYDWDENTDTHHMVSNIEVVIFPKWKMAARRVGTGTTKHIGSINKLDKLRKQEGEFSSEKEFETYWRLLETKRFPIERRKKLESSLD